MWRLYSYHHFANPASYCEPSLLLLRGQITKIPTFSLHTFFFFTFLRLANHFSWRERYFFLARKICRFKLIKKCHSNNFLQIVEKNILDIILRTILYLVNKK